MYDLADVSDYNAILRNRSNIQLRTSVKDYYRVLYFVQQLRRVKWCLFALFMTLCIEFQIRAFFPSNLESQAFLALCIALVVLGSIFILEHVMLVYGGDPENLLGECHDEELALLANEVKRIITDTLPANVGSRVSIDNLFTVSENSTATAAATTTAEAAAASSPSSVPLVHLNTAAPRSCIVLPNGSPQRTSRVAAAPIAPVDASRVRSMFREKGK
jgi:hypothetical protein